MFEGRTWITYWSDLSCELAMLQASLFDCLALDPFSIQQDGLSAPEVDIGGRQIIQALVISPVIIMIDELADGTF